MCTYRSELLDTAGSSAKGRDGWFGLERTMVSYDHPVHAPAGHTLNLDFLAPSLGPSARVAVELTADAARALAAAIITTLDETPALD